jgi:hypothetical protein
LEQSKFHVRIKRINSLLRSGNVVPVVIRKVKNKVVQKRNRILSARCDKKLALALDRIAAANMDDLRRVHFVELLIRQIGLANDKRNIYGDDEAYMNPIPRGLWQIPRQLAEFTVSLSSQKIGSFLEIGTYTGHTFTFLMAYLARFNPNLSGITVDVCDYSYDEYRKSVEPLLKGQFDARFIIGHSRDFATRALDFCFIDGDHSLKGVCADFDNVGQNAKICAFHDINDAIVEGWPGNDGGVPKFWQQLKTRHNDWDFSEFTWHSRGYRVMGIGVAIRKLSRTAMI